MTAIAEISDDEAQSRLDTCLVFTLVDLMLFGSRIWYTASLLFVCCLPAVASKRIRQTALPWIGVVAAFVHMIAINWATADNHKYVMTYWSLAVAISLRAKIKDRVDILSSNAAWILGLSMIFAAIWKAISSEYMSGAFFEIFFLTDKRLEGTVALLTDLTRGQLAENRGRLELLREGYFYNVNPTSQVLHSSALVKNMAFVATWWTIVIEGVKGALFVWPQEGKRLALARNISLLLFLFTTYTIAPVPGFGCTLACMGMATCIQQPGRWFKLYQIAYGFVVVCYIAAEPFRDAILRLTE